MGHTNCYAMYAMLLKNNFAIGTFGMFTYKLLLRSDDSDGETLLLLTWNNNNR